MRIFIILTLSFLASCGGLKKSSGTLPGGNIPPKAFTGDTLSYVQTSIIDKKDVFIGRQLKVLLDSLEIPVKSYLISITHKKIISPGLTLSFYNKSESSQKHHKGEKFVKIHIDWMNPVPKDSVNVLFDKSKGEWLEAERNYYGRQRIRDVQLFKYNY